MKLEPDASKAEPEMQQQQVVASDSPLAVYLELQQREHGSRLLELEQLNPTPRWRPTPDVPKQLDAPDTFQETHSNDSKQDTSSTSLRSTLSLLVLVAAGAYCGGGGGVLVVLLAVAAVAVLVVALDARMRRHVEVVGTLLQRYNTAYGRVLQRLADLELVSRGYCA